MLSGVYRHRFLGSIGFHKNIEVTAKYKSFKITPSVPLLVVYTPNIQSRCSFVVDYQVYNINRNFIKTATPRPRWAFVLTYKNRLSFLPVFDNFFVPTSRVHNYSTRLSSSNVYSLTSVRTNYEKFNIRFSGAKIWNSLESDLKLLSIGAFKARLKFNFISRY